MSALSVGPGDRRKWREFFALIGEVAAGPPVAELGQQLGWVQG
jgi:hypothetical protein